MKADLFGTLVFIFFVLSFILPRLLKGMKIDGPEKENWPGVPPRPPRPVESGQTVQTKPLPPSQPVTRAEEAPRESTLADRYETPTEASFDTHAIEDEVRDIETANERLGQLRERYAEAVPTQGARRRQGAAPEAMPGAEEPQDLVAGLRDPRTAAQAIVAAEVLGRPRAMRRHR